MSIFGSTLADFLPKRIIGAFEATVTIKETSTDSAEITQHPVQQGASITDHAYRKAAQLTLDVAWQDEPATLVDLYNKFLLLLSDCIPMTVVTGKRTYKNMLISGLTQTNDEQTERMLSLSISMQEIFIVSLAVVSVPERARQANAGKTGATENAGKKQAEAVGATESEKVESTLDVMFDND